MHSISAWNKSEHYSPLPYFRSLSHNVVSSVSFLRNANKLINSCLSQDHSNLRFHHDFLTARPFLSLLRTLDLHDSHPHCSLMGSSHSLNISTHVFIGNNSSACTERDNKDMIFSFDIIPGFWLSWGVWSWLSWQLSRSMKLFQETGSSCW